MIRKLTVRNFQGIETADLELGPITMLYGANGAGKSSLRDAIEHALTGEPCRGGVLADIIRQGAKSAEVEVVLEAKAPDGTPKPNGLSIIRRRSKSGGKQMSQGVEISAGDVQLDVEAAVGAPTRAITAALRAGALLELKPDDLQALLAGLTGAAFDASAILAAMPEGTAEAAKRAGLGLPGRFEDLPSHGKSAEGARQLAKRQVADREADLERTPAGKAGDEKALAAALKDLRARREKAAGAKAHDAGAREEKLRQLRAEVEKLRAVPAPAAVQDGDSGEAAEEALSRAESDARDAETKLAVAKSKLDDLKRDAGGDPEEDAKVLASADEITAALKAAKDAHAEAAERERELLAKGRDRKAQIERLPASGCVGPCPVLPDTECPVKCDGLREKLESDRAALIESYRTAKAALDSADKAVRAAIVETDRLDAALERQEARLKLQQVEAELGQLQRRMESARATVEKLRPVAAAAREARAAAARFEEAQKRAWKLEGEIAAVEKQATPAAVGEDVAQLDTQIAAAEAGLADAAQAQKRQAVEASVAKARQAVSDCDAVAQACKAARVALLAKAVEPFTAAANGALAKLAPGYAVEVGDALELLVKKGDILLRPGQLSDGERTRLLYVLQFAVCKLAGVRFLPLDRAELLDATGKAGLMKLVGECSAAGLQVLMLSCAAPPEAAPAGVTVYVVDGGRVRAVARKAA